MNLKQLNRYSFRTLLKSSDYEFRSYNDIKIPINVGSRTYEVVLLASALTSLVLIVKLEGKQNNKAQPTIKRHLKKTKQTFCDLHGMRKLKLEI